MKEALTSKARHALEPPVEIDIDEGVVDGVPVIVGLVREVDKSQKPCRVAGGAHRGVWIRAWDGDYRASDLEIQGLLANRSQPRFDAEAAPNTTRDDLDADLIADFLRNCRDGSEQLASLTDDDELLWHMGVTVTKRWGPVSRRSFGNGCLPTAASPHRRFAGRARLAERSRNRYTGVGCTPVRRADPSNDCGRNELGREIDPICDRFVR